MAKFAAGMLVGFFLATLLMFSMVQIYVAPYEGTIRTAAPYVQEAYKIAHSSYYSDAQGIATKVESAAEAIAALPLVGPVVDKAMVVQYAQAAITLLQNAKESSEVVVLLVGWSLAVIGFALPAIAISIAMILLGVWMYKKEEGEGGEGEGKQAGKKKR